MELTQLTVAEIKRATNAGEARLSANLLAKLGSDPRISVRRLAQRLRRQRVLRIREKGRLKRMLLAEQKQWDAGITRVAGVDEVGMGPLAGPVVAAAVIFSPGISIPGVNDSKRLSPRQREKLAGIISQEAVAVGIGEASVGEIDRLNIYHAGLLAMWRAVRALSPEPEVLFIDGRNILDLKIPQRAFPQGDRDHFSIASASIVAKVYRDQLMRNLGHVYPKYGLAQHKGYGTREHIEAIEKHGLTPVHRVSFLSRR